MLPGPERDDRVAGLVDRDRVPLPLDVLDILGRAEAAEDTVLPMPQYPSMKEATVVAESRSPETPDELSLSKNSRSPASEASATRMSDSYSLRHLVNWSSGGMLATIPR